MVRVVSFGEGQVGESGVLAPLKVGSMTMKKKASQGYMTRFNRSKRIGRRVHQPTYTTNHTRNRAWRWAT